MFRDVAIISATTPRIILKFAKKFYVGIWQIGKVVLFPSSKHLNLFFFGRPQTCQSTDLVCIISTTNLILKSGTQVKIRSNNYNKMRSKLWWIIEWTSIIYICGSRFSRNVWYDLEVCTCKWLFCTKFQYVYMDLKKLNKYSCGLLMKPRILLN